MKYLKFYMASIYYLFIHRMAFVILNIVIPNYLHSGSYQGTYAGYDARSWMQSAICSGGCTAGEG